MTAHIPLDVLIKGIDQKLSQVIDTKQQMLAERNLLLHHFCQIAPENRFAEPGQLVACDEQYQALQAVLNQRIQDRVPIQYLLGFSTFYGLDFTVSPAVLIPRPETELLAEAALAYCKKHAAKRVLDLGTGSGCLAIVLKHHIFGLDMVAVDISEAALDIARANAQQHQTAIHFLQGKWFAPLKPGEKFDLIVSNPPYIALDDRPTLSAEVLHEPEMALFSPDEPYNLYLELLTAAIPFLNQPGAIALECGFGQAETVMTLAQQHGYDCEILQDYGDVARILFCYRHGETSVALHG